MCFTTRARRNARHAKNPSLPWHCTKARANLVIVRVKEIFCWFCSRTHHENQKPFFVLLALATTTRRFLVAFFSHRLPFKMFMSWLHCAHIIFIGCISIVVVWHAPSCHKDCDYSTFSPTFIVYFFIRAFFFALSFCNHK